MTIAVILGHGEQWRTTTLIPPGLQINFAARQGTYESWAHALDLVASGEFASGPWLEHPTEVPQYRLGPLAQDEKEWFRQTLNSEVLGRLHPLLYHVGEGALAGVEYFCGTPETCEGYGNAHYTHHPDCTGLLNVMLKEGVTQLFTVNCRGDWLRSWLADRLPQQLARRVRPSLTEAEADPEFDAARWHLVRLIEGRKLYEAWQKYSSFSAAVQARLSGSEQRIRAMVVQVREAGGEQWFANAVRDFPHNDRPAARKVRGSYSHLAARQQLDGELPMPVSIDSSEHDAFQNLFLMWARGSGELERFLWNVLSLLAGEDFEKLQTFPASPEYSSDGQLLPIEEHQFLVGFPTVLADFALDVRRAWSDENRENLLRALGLERYQNLPDLLDGRVKELTEQRALPPSPQQGVPGGVAQPEPAPLEGPQLEEARAEQARREAERRRREDALLEYVGSVQATQRWLTQVKDEIHTAMSSDDPGSALSRFKAALQAKAQQIQAEQQG